MRRFDIPVAAEGNLSRLLIADIERKTPFRLSDVVYGHTLLRKPGSSDKYTVCLWILRRDIITRQIEAIGMGSEDLDYVTSAPGADFGRKDRPSLSAEAGSLPLVSQWCASAVLRDDRFKRCRLDGLDFA